MTKKRVRKIARSLLLAVLSLPFLGAMVFTALAGLAWLGEQGISVVGNAKCPLCVTPVEVASGDSLAEVRTEAREPGYLVDVEVAQMVARTAIPWWPSVIAPTTLVRMQFDERQ